MVAARLPPPPLTNADGRCYQKCAAPSSGCNKAATQILANRDVLQVAPNRHSKPI